MTDDEFDDAPEEERKSRSQLKREHQELKDLAAELVALSSGRLASIPLSERARRAVVAARPMDRAELKRQIGHLANFLEHEDVDTIRDVLAGELPPAEAEAEAEAGPTEAERWRDALIEGDDDSLMDFVEAHPEFDRQQLRQLVRKARKERERGKPPGSAQKLLEHLQERASPG